MPDDVSKLSAAAFAARMKRVRAGGERDEPPKPAPMPRHTYAWMETRRMKQKLTPDQVIGSNLLAIESTLRSFTERPAVAMHFPIGGADGFFFHVKEQFGRHYLSERESSWLDLSWVGLDVALFHLHNQHTTIASSRIVFGYQMSRHAELLSTGGTFAEREVFRLERSSIVHRSGSMVSVSVEGGLLPAFDLRLYGA